MRLKDSYFEHSDTLVIARDLLGKFLVSSAGGVITSGMIIETEAYLGIHDRASHAFGNRRTKRTEVMYQKGGCLYIYLCYGLHSLLNIITHQEGVPHGILIRAIKPMDGIEIMLKRRNKDRVTSRFTSGPGTVTQALGITTALSGERLGKTVWVEDRGVHIDPSHIQVTPRIGIAYAKEDALLPYRFRVI